MGVYFTKSDLEIFHIPDFKSRMTAIREQLRPKLVALGEELAPQLKDRLGLDFFPHTAKHMRRKVNPPDETWVAWGPEARGYKAYIFFGFCVGKGGAQARVTMKDESKLRPDFGKNLQNNLSFLQKRFADFKKLGDYTKRNDHYEAQTVNDFSSFIKLSSERLQKNKTALFDVGLPLKALSKSIAQETLTAFENLFPFFQCGLRPKIKLI